MVFMKEMRQTVMEECTLKESAAINQILGRRVSAPFHHFPANPCPGPVRLLCWRPVFQLAASQKL